MKWLFGTLRRKFFLGAHALVMMAAQAIMSAGFNFQFKMSTSHHYEQWRGGVLIDQWWEHNIVVNVGLDDILDKYFKGSAYTAAFYVMLTDGTPTIVAGDTMASHAGWVEVEDYSEATREALVLGSVASQSVDNSASKASFSINSDTTVIGGGAVTTVSTKGGTTGVLYGAAAFTAGDKSLDNGDTLNVTITLTAA